MSSKVFVNRLLALWIPALLLICTISPLVTSIPTDSIVPPIINKAPEGPITNGPPYVIDAFYVNGSVTIDGDLSEPAWSDPRTSVTQTTEVFNDWNLTIYTFHDDLSLFVGVEIYGDTAQNPNDFCEIGFDADHDGVNPPEDTDLKLRAESTVPAWNEYALYYGNGTDWNQSSNESGIPNPWPAGYDVNASIQSNATYEFQIPISAAWGDPSPQEGNITGFIVHGFGQSDNEHVWWPDNYYTGNNPPTEDCDDPSGYGDLIFHLPGASPDVISYVSGNGQHNQTGDPLNEPFLVKVTDQFGNPVPNVEIDWAINGTPPGATGHLMNPTTNTTNATGIAGSFMILGDEVGWYYICATNLTFDLTGEPVNFSARAMPPPIHINIVSGNNQRASLDTTLPLPLVVNVTYDDGTLVGPGIPVWFNVTLGGGSIDISPVLTNSNGIAQANLTLGLIAGINNVTAQISTTGTSSVNFTAIGTLPFIYALKETNVTKIMAGEIINYLISYGNNGTENATDVWINDTLSTELIYVGDTSGIPPIVSGMSYSWYFPSVPMGANSFLLTVRVSVSTANGTQISNSFSVDYSDQLGKSLPTETSNTIIVEVISEPIQNTPPTIEGVPDLIVHYDYDYVFDLLPYIIDPDNEPEELFLIFSDSIHVRINPINNLGMVINYPFDYLGTIQVLNITVSDGLGSDWDVINVEISENYPPEIIDEIPDVTLDEDTVAYPFNITHYFYDRDGDALYYTYGEKNINITFLPNNTVIVTPFPDWFGLERVTFRATDPTNALIEDTINITVRPVNDPPVILPIPDQSGEVDVSWVLDLSPYLQDIDNLLSELTVSIDTSNVVVNGLNLTFRFPRAMTLDILTITVSDGEAEASIQINLVVTGPSLFDDILPWVIPIIILFALLLLLLAYKRRKPTLEHIFLIYRSGVLIAHETTRLVPDFDSELFSGMLTAIQGFVKDSFKDEKDWGLKKLEFGEHKIAVEQGKSGWVYLALIYTGKGDEERLSKLAGNILEDIESAYGDVLEDWNGDLEILRGSRDIISDHILKGRG